MMAVEVEVTGKSPSFDICLIGPLPLESLIFR